MNYPDQNDIKPINESGYNEEQFQLDAKAFNEWVKHKKLNTPTKRKRGRPQKYTDEQLTESQRKQRERNRERNKAAIQMQLLGSTKEQFLEVQRTESAKLGFKLSHQQTVQMILNSYHREQHIER
jgi:hypothetical protein